MDHSTKIKRKAHLTRLCGQGGPESQGDKSRNKSRSRRLPLTHEDSRLSDSFGDLGGDIQIFHLLHYCLLICKMEDKSLLGLSRYLQILTRNKSLKYKKHGLIPMRIANVKKSDKKKKKEI